jgi:16S rRNA (cytosine1402-N4)-methyltransferase
MHTPVLLQEAIDGLNVISGGRYIDATFGEGGYSQEILKRGGKVLGIDLDKNQLTSSRVNELTGLKLVEGNFADIEKIAKENDFFPVEGVVFDLGLSMRQLNESGRGFSYKKFNEPLDMRLSLGLEVKASDLINSLDEEKLYEILAKNSEELNSRIISKAVVRARQIRKIKTVEDLIKTIDQGLGQSDKRVYQRVFQALRIEVNQEFNNLKKGLNGALRILKNEGRIVIISFHSLEDRIIKNFGKTERIKIVTKKPIRKSGGRSFEKSAKLRIFLKNYEKLN